MRKRVLALLLTLGAGSARADNWSFYVGAGAADHSVHDIASGNADLGNIHSSSWKAFAGIRPIPVFAIEADYLDLGTATVSPNIEVRGDVTYKAFAGYAVGFLPIPAPYLDVFGKAGLGRWSSSGSVQGFSTAPPFSLSSEGTNFAWGVGTQVHVGHIGARLEYESFKVPNTNGANVVSLSVFLNLY